MERVREKQREHQIIKEKQTAQSSTATSSCPQCKTINDIDSNYCENCGALIYVHSCPGCGALLDEGVDFCESCHTYLQKNKCSFCGEDLDGEDHFCGYCGSPRDGIICPECETRNMFNFCSFCGIPLTDLAKMELKRVQSIPEYSKVSKLVEELEELEEELEIEEYNSKTRGDTIGVDERELPEKNINVSLPPKKAETGEKIYIPEKKNIVAEQTTREDKELVITRKKKELQALLDKLESSPKTTPALTRNYQMACKPGCSSVGWKCNYKHAIHANPQGCAYPHKGGKWIIVDKSGDDFVNDKIKK